MSAIASRTHWRAGCGLRAMVCHSSALASSVCWPSWVRAMTFTPNWHIDLAHPYIAAATSLTGEDAFRYAPPIAFVSSPASLIPFEAFRLA